MSEQTEERPSTADLIAENGSHEVRADDRDTNQPLLDAEDGRDFQDRWERVQVAFVDEPQTSVRDADALVAELMQKLAGTFAEERSRLEGEWERGEEVSTEDLRQALQHYRSFFQRLLAA
jgi:hypothetical protein